MGSVAGCVSSSCFGGANCVLLPDGVMTRLASVPGGFSTAVQLSCTADPAQANRGLTVKSWMIGCTTSKPRARNLSAEGCEFAVVGQLAEGSPPPKQRARRWLCVVHRLDIGHCLQIVALPPVQRAAEKLQCVLLQRAQELLGPRSAEQPRGLDRTGIGPLVHRNQRG